MAQHGDDIEMLKKIVKELEEKSNYHDNLISEVKSTTESNTLNISLNQHQMQQINTEGKKKIDKTNPLVNEKIVNMQVLIDELYKLSKMPSGSGDVDINMFDGRYAGKNPPDNTILRIETLEKEVKNLAKHNEKNQKQDNRQDEDIAKMMA